MNQRQELMARFERLQGVVNKRLSGVDCRAELLESFGAITLHQLTALRQLVEGGPCTMHDLATRIDITPSAATALVDRLVQQGFAERTGDPGDRRVLRVSATSTADAAVKKFQKSRRRQLAEMFDRLTDDELNTFVSLAERMVADVAVAAQE